MRRIARATVATVAAVVMTPVVAYAEPMVLTATQMASITAAARSPVININVVKQTDITTQIANAVALSFATCGVCVGDGPSAFSFATARNFNSSGQLVRR
jgi:hypothetical protein